jgi:hypothetical protein
MIPINNQNGHQRRFFGCVSDFVSISAAGIGPDCAVAVSVK